MRTLRIYKNKYRETGSYLLKIYSLHPTQVKHKNIKKKISECVNRTNLEVHQHTDKSLQKRGQVCTLLPAFLQTFACAPLHCKICLT